jgi:hypothetical protein
MTVNQSASVTDKTCLEKQKTIMKKKMEEMIYKNRQVRITDTAAVCFLLLVVHLMLLSVTQNDRE